MGNELNNLLETFLNDGTNRTSGHSIPVDIVEEEGRYVVNAELPGVRKGDLKISMHEGKLSINAERKHKDVPEEASRLRNEIALGQYRRTITIPAEIKLDEITAELANGILQIVLPKSDNARVREIRLK
jgi:HSP20 family protein